MINRPHSSSKPKAVKNSRSLKMLCHALLAATSLMLSFSSNLYAEQTVPTVSFSNIITGYSAGAQEAMVVGGGRWLTQRTLVHSAVLVHHPKGRFMWDSGLGREVGQQMQSFSIIDRQLFKIERHNPAINQLEEAKYPISELMAIIPSHMHWDHVSGIEDFIGIPVWLRKVEHDQAKLGEPPAFVRSQFDSDQLVWQYLELENVPYEGFDRSLDVFKDGSVILVDLYGHTYGQLGLFLNTEKGRYFFIGDTTWTIEGVTNNVGRPKFLNWMMGIDIDIEANDRLIEHLHGLSHTQNDLTIVPAHDENIVQQLPIYPDFL